MPFWAPGVFWILSGDFSEAFFSDARRQGSFSASCALFCLSPFRSVLRPHTFSRSPSRLSSRSGQPRVGFLSRKGRNIGWSRPPLARVRARGSASRAEGWSPPVSGFLTASFGSHRVTGTPWAFLIRGGGALSAPSGPFSHALVFCFPAPGFFLCAMSDRHGMTNSKRCSENTAELHVASRNLRPQRTPPPILRILLDLRGNAVRFFPAMGVGKSP